MAIPVFAGNRSHDAFEEQLCHHCWKLSLVETPLDCVLYRIWAWNGRATDKASLHTLHMVSGVREPKTWEGFRSEALRGRLQLVQVDAATS